MGRERERERKRERERFRLTLGKLRQRHVDILRQPTCLPAHDCATQKGVKSVSAILTQFVLGRPNEKSANSRRVAVCDMNPREGDWLEACWALQERFTSGDDLPLVVAMGICKPTVTESGDVRSPGHSLKAQLTDILLNGWWERQTDMAGPPDPPFSVSDMVQKPVLGFLTLDGATPCIPQSILKRFPQESEYADAWQKFCSDLAGQLTKLAATGAAETSASPLPRSQQHIQQRPHVFDSEPPLPTFNRELVLDEVPLADFDMSTVPLGSCL